MKIIWADAAIQELKAIAAYLDLQSQQAAAIVFPEIFYVVDNIAAIPASFQMEENLKHLNLGHRYAVVFSYKIIFRQIQNLDAVFITDIFHTALHPKRMESRTKRAEKDNS